MYSCVIFLATSYYYTVFRKVHILVSYSWQPRIIAPYSKRCIFFVSYSWQPCIITLYSERCIFLCHILGNLVLLHRILKHVLIVFLCHILGNLILLHCILKGAYSCVISLATLYYCTVFQKVHILVSYSWQPHIITPYSERCIFLCHILGNLVLLHRILKHVLIVFLCHILGNLILLHCIPKGAYSCVTFLATLYY